MNICKLIHKALLLSYGCISTKPSGFYETILYVLWFAISLYRLFEFLYLIYVYVLVNIDSDNFSFYH